MNTLLQAIVNVAGLLPALTSLVVAIAFISGLWFFAKGIIAMARPERSGSEPDVGFVVTHVVVGALLIALGSWVIMLTQTLFSTGTVSTAEEIFAYAPGTIGLVEDETTRTVIRSIIAIIQFIGLIGIIRGLFLFSAYSKQAVRSIGPAFTFLFAGILAMNFPRVVGAFSQLFM